MLKIYDTSYLQRKKVHSVVISSVHLRSMSLQSLVRWEMKISVSQRQSVNESDNSQ